MTDTGSAVPGQPFVSYCPDPAACTNGMYFQNEARNFDHREKTRDLSANLQWDATDQLHFNVDAQWIKAERSEEHTSELQSLMRIPYAVFCLKKKNNKKT